MTSSQPGAVASGAMRSTIDVHWTGVDRDRVLQLIGDWADRGWLRDLDRVFARFVATHCPMATPLALAAAALASHQLGRGHVCLDLRAALADPRFVLSLPPDDDRDHRGADASAEVTLPERFLAGLTVERWRASIAADQVGVMDAEGKDSVAVDEPSIDASETPDAMTRSSPLVLDGDRLYLRRFWRYERQVGAAIGERLRADPNGLRSTHGSTDRQMDDGAARRLARVRVVLDTLFDQPVATSAAHVVDHRLRPAAIDWQKGACALALRSGFSVITGGPGTGKTTTVIRLLALLQALAFSGELGVNAQRQGLRIQLAAPTGKAAARLNETIAGAVGRLSLVGLDDAERVRRAIPTDVVTLHRLLGSRPDTRRLRHDRSNPLLLDLLVVDEASMIDLEMMHALLQALPTSARLVLLGDKDQLASVEAGAVLGQLCRRADAGHYSVTTAKWLTAIAGVDIDQAMIDALAPALDQSIAMLRHSHRFSAASGIGRLARAVNEGDDAAALRILSEDHPDLAWVTLTATLARRPRDDTALAALVLDGGLSAASAGGEHRSGYRHYLDCLRDDDPGDGASAAAVDAWAHRVLQQFSRFQLLCATRRADDGVEQVNRRIERLLAAAGLISVGSHWYSGRPVMVTRNDYALGLMNGDVGIAIDCPVANPGNSGQTAMRRLRVAFVVGDGSGRIRWVLPSRLQAVETVYAMTVHKAQGSEFDHAALWLPARSSPVLTRELVYTAITRARRWFTLVRSDADTSVLRNAITRRVQRAGALGDLTD